MGGRRIELCGVSVVVETNHEEFARYLDAQFPETPAEDRPPDIAVRVRWTEGEDRLAPQAVFPGWPVDVRVDRHVWVGAGRVLCLRADDAPAIAIASAPAEPTRVFELRYQFSLGGRGWREAAKRLLRRRRLAALRRSRLSTLAYYAVYYPVWWQLEARGVAHPLHAAGVALDGRGLLLAGFPGCGKSTLATAFLGMPGSELLSDNVVLHDGTQIFGCFEPLLLDAATRAGLAARVPLTPVGRRHQYARDAFHAPHRTGGVPLAAAVVLARGHATRLARVSSTECARLILAANEAAKEVRRYHVLAALLGLAERDALAHFERRVSDLDRLLARVPCYWLEVREGAPAEGTGMLRGLAERASEVAS